MVNRTETEANSIISGAGLVPARTEATSETVPAGIVISQDPISGTTVDLGSTVNITVSIGPPP